MKIFRSPMDKILYEQENATIITNPRQPVKTFFRKVSYLIALWTFKLKNLFRRS